MVTLFDHAATTPVDPRVLAAMTPWFGDAGNPSAGHPLGRRARLAVETARADVAAFLGAPEPQQVVFTASGTEANAAVVLGLLLDPPTDPRRRRLVVSGFEHPSVLRAAARLEPHGFVVDRVAPCRNGRIDPEQFAAHLGDDVALASLMLVSNLFGTVQPVAAVGQACREHAIPLLVDAVQAAGKLPLAVEELVADYVVVGAHKFGGPLGAAAVWINPGARWSPLLEGGGQEGGRRASTENVPALVGLAAACGFATSELEERSQRWLSYRSRIETVATSLGAVVHGADAERVAAISLVEFPGRVGRELALELEQAGLAVSAGPACSATKPTPIPGLLAAGLTPNEALSTVRISLGASTTAGDAELLVAALQSVVGRA
jgi:cysteine desulfurase